MYSSLLCCGREVIEFAWLPTNVHEMDFVSGIFLSENCQVGSYQCYRCFFVCFVSPPTCFGQLFCFCLRIAFCLIETEEKSSVTLMQENAYLIHTLSMSAFSITLSLNNSNLYFNRNIQLCYILNAQKKCL